MRWYLRSKIHKATVTEAKVKIDKVLMEKVGLKEGEKVKVWDITNGERLETYVIIGEKNSGIICINGASARKIKKGDKIIIAGFDILVDKKNKFVKYL